MNLVAKSPRLLVVLSRVLVGGLLLHDVAHVLVRLGTGFVMKQNLKLVI